MHCDSVTVACDKGESLSSFDGQTNFTKLISAECIAQCFAIFTEGKTCATDFERYVAFYNAQICSSSSIIPVLCADDLQRAVREKKTGAILTAENLGFLNGDLSRIAYLKNIGVKMASLVWNNKNLFAFPNIIYKGNQPDFSLRERRGLTPLGREAVKELNRQKIIIDISHLSDGGVEDVLKLSSFPVVASHSNCRKVCNHPRNLSDSQLKKIADKGGVCALNFCFDFVGVGDVFENLFRHYMHMVKVGGEDLPAIGSDFDGIPPYEDLKDCLKVNELLRYFGDRGVKGNALEKLAYKNFFRVFSAVCG